MKKEEGGRHTAFGNNYAPQFFFGTAGVTGDVLLDDENGRIMPGDEAEFNVDLRVPIALEIGACFAIREGGRTVGAGQVLSISE